MEGTHNAVVIGAGIAGLITAHRYLCLHPTADLIILDRNKHIGGVYSQDRVYPGFHTQFVIGLAEYADLKMRKPAKEDFVGDCFKAQWLGRYLEEFAEKMVHDGRSLRSRIRLDVQIEKVGDEWKKEKGQGEARWRLLCRNSPPNGGGNVLGESAVENDIQQLDATVLRARKLIIATGTASTPNIPHFDSQDQFDAPIIHSTNFGASNLLSQPNINHVTIFGAGKSSADMLYTCIKSLPPTTSFHWIIRPDGVGPGFFAPLDVKTPYSNGVEAAQTRALGLLQPSAWHREGWWVWLLHRTWVGIRLVGWIFGKVDEEAKARARYSTRPEAANRGFEKLEYSPGIFWQNNPGGALHHPDFWDLVASRVTVHRTSITSMSHHTLHLSDNTNISSEVLLLGTGFQTSLNYLPQDLRAELGAIHNPDVDTPATAKKWAELEARADKQVLKRFPILANPPEHFLKKAATTPYRLYRGIAPIYNSSRDIVFINHLITANMIMNAEAQAHWAVAYLSDAVELPPVEQMEKDVAMQVAYSKRRCLSAGRLGNNFAFDMVAYIDRLMEELGVAETWKRKGAWGVNRPEDLGETWNAWVEKVGRERKM